MLSVLLSPLSVHLIYTLGLPVRLSFPTFLSLSRSFSTPFCTCPTLLYIFNLGNDITTIPTQVKKKKQQQKKAEVPPRGAVGSGCPNRCGGFGKVLI